MQGNAADRRKRSFLEAKARGGQKSGHGAGNPNRFRVDSISAASAGHSVTNTKLCHPTTGSDHLASAAVAEGSRFIQAVANGVQSS